jgi:hypothetical protein
MSASVALAAIGLLCGVVVPSSLLAQESDHTLLAHTRITFTFTVNAPFGQAAPLFGADEERKWAPGWDPQFVYPNPAKDQAGAVFLVKHGPNSSVWTTTAFDLTDGYVQYVYVMNHVMVTLIDIRLTRHSAQRTGVSVTYERTALTSQANDHIADLAKQDEGFAKEWEDQINDYLQKSQSKNTP